jgi:hypothetical protein
VVEKEVLLVKESTQNKNTKLTLTNQGKERKQVSISIDRQRNYFYNNKVL